MLGNFKGLGDNGNLIEIEVLIGLTGLGRGLDNLSKISLKDLGFNKCFDRLSMRFWILADWNIILGFLGFLGLFNKNWNLEFYIFECFLLL